MPVDVVQGLFGNVMPRWLVGVYLRSIAVMGKGVVEEVLRPPCGKGVTSPLTGIASILHKMATATEQINDDLFSLLIEIAAPLSECLQNSITIPLETSSLITNLIDMASTSPTFSLNRTPDEMIAIAVSGFQALDPPRLNNLLFSPFMIPMIDSSALSDLVEHALQSAINLYLAIMMEWIPNSTNPSNRAPWPLSGQKHHDALIITSLVCSTPFIINESVFETVMSILGFYNSVSWFHARRVSTAVASLLTAFEKARGGSGGWDCDDGEGDCLRVLRKVVSRGGDFRRS
ncbi:hypothetical protein HDU67_004749 [Dinochytrium kinnereticum]|nr:hypothetical protein HDU67_004749 [Dinochytrium kinnereticum]